LRLARHAHGQGFVFMVRDDYALAMPKHRGRLEQGFQRLVGAGGKLCFHFAMAAGAGIFWSRTAFLPRQTGGQNMQTTQVGYPCCLRLGMGLAAAGLSLTAVAGNYWQGVGRTLPVSPQGNVVAVSCHNCYGSSNADTQAQVAMALGRDFDLVELDLTVHSDGQVYVEHDRSEAAVGTLAQALANPALQQSNRLLFLELKGNYTTPADSDALVLGVLRAIRDGGYATAKRPATLRAFMDGNNRQQHLVRAKSLLSLAEFAGIRSYVRFHSLLRSDVLNGIRISKQMGLEGVELEYRTPDLAAGLQLARQLGLGVGVFTTPASEGERYLLGLRDEVDFITTDYDRAQTAAARSVRSLIQANLPSNHAEGAP